MPPAGGPPADGSDASRRDRLSTVHVGRQRGGERRESLQTVDGEGSHRVEDEQTEGEREQDALQLSA